MDSRPRNDGKFTYRRTECKPCGHRFSSVEMPLIGVEGQIFIDKIVPMFNAFIALRKHQITIVSTVMSAFNKVNKLEKYSD